MEQIKIPFNKPYLTGKEEHYLYQAVNSGKISGNGMFTQKCQNFFQEKYNFKKCLLTTSCTDALEMAAILANIGAGDEVIVPSFTFVSSAVAFVRQGAKVVFVDSLQNHPGMDEDKIEPLITAKTKAIVVVHYAGVACDMAKIMEIAHRFNLIVIEDAAQAIESSFNGVPLGGIGHLACFSFHETKNIQCGEGGMLVVNDEKLMARAEIIWEKGTNRNAFFRGEVDKYGWVDIGSSFLPSEIAAAFLYAQIEEINVIQNHRLELWQIYFHRLNKLQKLGIKLPYLPEYATNNAHLFYLICTSEIQRNQLISYLKERGIYAVFHYQSLHRSKYYSERFEVPTLAQSDFYTDCLLRLPLFFELQTSDCEFISDQILNFFGLANTL